MYYYYGQLIMKNKDYYNLNTIDYYQLDEETITIYHIGYQNNTIAIIEKYFDEPPFRAFMRWLESQWWRTLFSQVIIEVDNYCLLRRERI